MICCICRWWMYDAVFWIRGMSCAFCLIESSIVCENKSKSNQLQLKLKLDKGIIVWPSFCVRLPACTFATIPVHLPLSSRDTEARWCVLAVTGLVVRTPTWSMTKCIPSPVIRNSLVRIIKGGGSPQLLLLTVREEHEHRAGYRWSPVRTLPVAPMWCDLGLWSRTVEVIKLRRGNEAFPPFKLTLQVSKTGGWSSESVGIPTPTPSAKKKLRRAFKMLYQLLKFLLCLNANKQQRFEYEIASDQMRWLF